MNVQNVLSYNNESLCMPEAILGMDLHLNKVNARGIHLGWLVVGANTVAVTKPKSILGYSCTVTTISIIIIIISRKPHFIKVEGVAIYLKLIQNILQQSVDTLDWHFLH